MEQYRHVLESQFATCQANLACYEDHLERAQAASLKFPDVPALEERLATCEYLLAFTRCRHRSLIPPPLFISLAVATDSLGSHHKNRSVNCLYVPTR
jgi:hypothetical protein